MELAAARRRARANPLLATGVISLVGYGLVAGVFAGALPFPRIGRDTVILLSDLIAVVNSAALVALLAGWRFIRRGDVRRHRAAMLASFGLILLFLVLYLWKVGGGFEKSLVAPAGVKLVYLAMLGVHLVLSVVAVPVVVYAVVLGLTRSPAELRETNHARVGRVAVAAWAVSLALGLCTYVLLNHVYDWVPLHRGAALLLLAIPRSD